MIPDILKDADQLTEGLERRGVIGSTVILSAVAAMVAGAGVLARISH